MVCALVIDVNASGRKVRMFVCAFSVAQWANMDTLGADTSRTLYGAGKQELLDDPVGGGRFVKTALIRVCLTLSYIWMVPCFYCYVHEISYTKHMTFHATWPSLDPMPRSHAFPVVEKAWDRGYMHPLHSTDTVFLHM